MHAPAAPQTSSSLYRYYALFLLTLVYVLSFVDRQILAILMPSIKTELAISDTQLGFLSGLAFAVFYSIVGIPIARLADRKNRRNIIAVSVALWSVMTALSGLATSYATLVAARIGVGIGEGGGTPPSHSILSDHFGMNRRATAMAVYATGIPIGILIGLLIGGWLGQTYGWRTAFLLVGIPGIAVALLVRLTIREPVRSNRADTPQVSLRDFLRHVGRFRSAPHFVIGASLQTFVSYGFSQWAPSFLVRSFDYSLLQAGQSLALVIGCAGGLGTLLGGTIVDRLAAFDKRWYMWVPGLAALLYIPLISFVYAAETGRSATLWMIAPVFLSLVYVGPIQALTQTLAGPALRATASASLLLMLNLIGLGLGPQLVGIVSDALASSYGANSLRYALLYVSTGAAAWSALHYLFASRHIRRDLAEAASWETTRS